MNRRIECRQVSAKAAVRSRPTVVIAEDDPATRMLLCRILTRASFVVHAFENGELALEAVRLTPPDVIVLDWVMPVMDGVRVAELLKADAGTREIPIVMLSTHAQARDRSRALETGVQDFLTKPCRADELVACIERQLAAGAPA
jgi:two-component system phosphate regulon response regulator PhoB